MCGGSGGDSWDEARVGEQEVLVVLKKDQLDKANKDTHHKLLPEDFQVSPVHHHLFSRRSTGRIIH